MQRIHSRDFDNMNTVTNSVTHHHNVAEQCKTSFASAGWRHNVGTTVFCWFWALSTLVELAVSEMSTFLYYAVVSNCFQPPEGSKSNLEELSRVDKDKVRRGLKSSCPTVCFIISASLQFPDNNSKPWQQVWNFLPTWCCVFTSVVSFLKAAAFICDQNVWQQRLWAPCERKVDANCWRDVTVVLMPKTQHVTRFYHDCTTLTRQSHQSIGLLDLILTLLILRENRL